jgi:hypothetical protein
VLQWCYSVAAVSHKGALQAVSGVLTHCDEVSSITRGAALQQTPHKNKKRKKQKAKHTPDYTRLPCAESKAVMHTP